jgi:hypothetical protein
MVTKNSIQLDDEEDQELSSSLAELNSSSEQRNKQKK